MEPREGQRFKDFDEFICLVKAYAVRSNFVFSILDSHRNATNKYVKLGCKHFGEPRSKSKGVRPMQKTFKQKCPAFVYCKQGEGCVIISQLNLLHNHVCDPDHALHYPERRQLSSQEKTVVGNLISYNIKPALLQKEIAAVFRDLTGQGNQRKVWEIKAGQRKVRENDSETSESRNLGPSEFDIT